MAWPDCYLPLRRMEQQLNIGDGIEFLHAKLIEGDLFPGDSDCRAFISHLRELPADYLISFQIKFTDPFLWNLLEPDWPIDAVGDVVINVWIIIDPMMVDRNKAAEDSFINDLHGWHAAAHVMLAVLQQNLNCLKLLHRYNGVMPILV